MVDAINFSAEELENRINFCRLRGHDWEDVMKGVSLYSHAIEKGDNRNRDIAESRAFYWVSMADVAFEMNHDFKSALDCCLRSMNI
jgi:hypothetical protein